MPIECHYRNETTLHVVINGDLEANHQDGLFPYRWRRIMKSHQEFLVGPLVSGCVRAA
jgi:hypothetical protein